MDDTIEFQEFLNVKIHAGTIVSAYRNAKARKNAYVMEVDFGTELGIKTTSAQVTEKYSIEELVGKQIVAVTNFPPLRVAGIKSEVLVLGVVEDGGVVLLEPGMPVRDGARVA